MSNPEGFANCQAVFRLAIMKSLAPKRRTASPLFRGLRNSDKQRPQRLRFREYSAYPMVALSCPARQRFGSFRDRAKRAPSLSEEVSQVGASEV